MGFKKEINKILIIFLIFLLGFLLRLGFAPRENESSDPFVVLTSAKLLAETGRYLVPSLGSADFKIKYLLPSWPVGFPLMLSTIFKFFGYSEFLARIFTIFLTSLTIIFVVLIANLFFTDKVAYLAGIIMAIHPLLVAFNGRIFTNNAALPFLIASITFLLSSVVEKDKELRFVDPVTIINSRKRLINFLIAFLSLGFLFSIRDTEAIFLLVYLYILNKAHFFAVKNKERLKAITKLFFMAIFVFTLAYLPNIYYNLQNFGTILASAHYKTGYRLNLNYLLFGSGSLLGLPGFFVMLLSIIVYCFPLASLFFMKSFTKKEHFFVAIFVLISIPLILINGSYYFASTGAAPRYILPLVPFTCILTADSLMNLSSRKKLPYRGILLSVLIFWQIFLTYPIPLFFKISPKFAYFAHYAPVSQIHPYENYPSHSNALAKWVKENTPGNSVIITPSRLYHFYYYAKRDVIGYTISDELKSNLKKIVEERPVYLLEEHEATYYPEGVNRMKKFINEQGLDYSVVGELKLFSPKIGHTKMHIYRITKE